MNTIFLTLAGLMGACGVVLAAAGAHSQPGFGMTGAGLDSAANMLLFHACATIAVTLASHNGLTARAPSRLAAAGFILGAALFAGDIALRAYAGHRLFPFAAPTGGTLLILSWLSVAIAALARRR